MNYVKLGNTGLKVSRLCIGCMSYGGRYAGRFEWTLGYEDAKKIIDKALDHVINFFDTADVYSNGKSEEIVGKGLEGRRNDVVIATKVFSPTGEGPNERGLGRKHVRQNLKRSLGNLRTDHVDLYQIHRWDYDTPIVEVLNTLTQLVSVMVRSTTSGRQACGHGSSQRPCTQATGWGLKGSSVCRTTTTWPIGRKSGK